MLAMMIVLIYYVVGAARIWFMHHTEGGFRNLLMWRTIRIRQRIPGVPVGLLAFGETAALLMRVTVWPLSKNQWRRLVKVSPEEGNRIDEEIAEFMAALKEKQKVQ